jgi:hypothetical protein
MGHIGDVHAQSDSTFAQVLDRDRIVEIARVEWIDRNRQQIADVATLGILVGIEVCCRLVEPRSRPRVKTRPGWRAGGSGP